MINKTLCFSSFSSEHYWRDETFASFSLIPDRQGENIVNVMDEMQYAFCLDDEAVLLTNIAMNKIHLQYLQALGLQIRNEYLFPASELENVKQSVANSLLEDSNTFVKLKSEHFSRVVNYSIIPHIKELTEQILGKCDVPELDTVKRVNSKLFSTNLGNRIGDLSGNIVFGTDNLLTTGLDMLESSPLLVKDPFGVSGAGNVLVDKPASLQSIVRFLSKQELSGKKVEFIIEPFYEKERDFSSLFHIKKDGKIDFIGIEIMENKGFSFSKIYPAEDSFIHAITGKGYFGKVIRAVKELADEGYWGPVCIDSMLLKDGTIKIIVEINARYSMGFINEFIGKKMNEISSITSLYQLSTLNIISKKVSSFDVLFHQLERSGILYDVKKGSGIFPVSANTWDINDNKVYSSYKKRFYYMVFYRNQEEIDFLSGMLDNIANSLN